MVKSIRNKSGLVVNWFKDIKNKHGRHFIQFDIVSFYPSITPTLLDDALTWAAELVELTPQQTKIIFQSRKSFLYMNGEPWVKKGDILMWEWEAMTVPRSANLWDCLSSVK